MVRIFFYYFYLELNCFCIICKNNDPFNFFECFKGKHILYFFPSILSVIIIILVYYIFLLFSFKRNETKVSSLIRHLIINRKKTFFFCEVYLIILDSISYKYDIRSFLSLSFLLCSLINFLFCYKENYYRRKLRLEDFIRIYLLSLNVNSNFLLFINYLLKRKDIKVKGIIYIFFIISFILIGIIIVSKNHLFLFKFKNMINLGELELYNQLSMILYLIQNKKNNRTEFLNLMSFISLEIEKNFHKIEKINFLDESKDKKNDHILYLYVDHIFKKKTELFNRNILLKMQYSDFLYNILQKYKKAYQTIYQLNLDIENNYIYSSLSEAFYVYRIKREIEERSINNIYDGSDISFQYQSHTLMKYISQIAEVYYNFWNLLLNSTQKEDLNKLDEYANEIILLKEEIDKKYNAIINSKNECFKITEYYILYLKDILKDKEKANNILNSKLEKYKYLSVNDENNLNSNVIYDIENIFPSSHFQFMIISLEKNSIGNILKISSDFSGKIGYYSDELIGQNLSILIPSFLKEEHSKIIERLVKEDFFFNENQKSKKFIVYCKCKSKYIIPLPLILKIIYDEDKKPFILAKLDQESEIIISKTINKYHIIVNGNYIIKNYTSNCIIELNFDNINLNNNCSIIKYLKEFYEETIKTFMECNEYYDKKQLVYNIIKDNFMTQFPEKKITWTKNNKVYLMNCEEIKMNDKIMGFIFHFENINNISSTILSSRSRRESIEASKLSFLTNNKMNNNNSYTNMNTKENYIHDDLKNIKYNFIPFNKEQIHFDIRNKEYIFNKNNNSNQKKIESISDYFKKEILKEKVENIEIIETNSYNSSNYSNEETKIKQLNNEEKKSEYEESEYEDSEEEETEEEETEEENKIESSFSSHIEEDKKVKSKLFTKTKSIKSNNKNINRPKLNFKDIDLTTEYYFNKNSNDNNNNQINKKEIPYKVDLSNITFFKYNFEKNKLDKYSKIYNTSKLNERMGLESSMSHRITQEKLKRKRIPLNKIMKYTFTKLFILPELNKLNSKTITRNSKIINKYISVKKFNLSIKLLIISTLLSLTFVIIFYIYFFQQCFISRTDIESVARINRYLSNLRDNSNDIFYQSFQFAILNNHHYYNFNPPRETLKNESKYTLLKLYNENLLLIQDLSLYKDSLSKKYRKMLDNYKSDFVSISSNLEVNITIDKTINLFYEFTYCVYNYAISDDNDIHLRNLDYNFILYNAKIFYSQGFENYIKIYLEVYNERKNRTIFLNYILTLIFFIFGFFFLYLIYKANNLVIKDKEKLLRLFFLIEIPNIKTSLYKCEKFMDKEKTWTSHINAKENPEIEDNENESLEESDMIINENTKLIDILTTKEKTSNNNDMINNIKKKIKEKNNKVIIHEKGTNNYIIIFIIKKILLFLILLCISIKLSTEYNSFIQYTNIYFLIQSHKTFYSKYFNYIRMYITYYSKENNDPMIKFINNTLKENINEIFILNNKYLYDSIMNVKKYNLPSNSTNLFMDIMKGDLCVFFEGYSLFYNVSCDTLCDGIVRKGLINILNYGIQNILYLMQKINNAIEKVKKLNFKYNEVLYGTDDYYNLYPKNKSEWHLYEQLNPFLLVNDNICKNLTILTENVIKNITISMIDNIKKEIIDKFENIKKVLTILCFLFGFIIFIPTIFYIIPDIIRKNNDINKKRKLLAIIPKEIMAEILLNNNHEI